MTDATFTIINKGIAAMGSAGVPGQQQIDAVLATIDKRLKSIQDNIQPRNFLKKITKPIQNLAKSTFKGFFGGFTIGSLIKQSQVFTATAGSFFQIAGAMIDTILAPLAPALSKTITASATIGIKAARNVAKISETVGPILDQIPNLIEGFANMVPNLIKFLFSVGKIVKELFSQGSISGMIIFMIQNLWRGLVFAGESVYKAVLLPLWDKFVTWWQNTMPDWLGGKKHKVSQPIIEKGRITNVDMLKRMGGPASAVAGLNISNEVAQIPTSVPNAFIQKPETAAQVVANLQTGAALVQDIYSGFHRGGEMPGMGGDLFSSKTPGLKDTVNKVISLVNSPASMTSELKSVLSGIQATEVAKSITGVAGGIDDDITRTKMSLKGLEAVFGQAGGTGQAEGGFH